MLRLGMGMGVAWVVSERDNIVEFVPHVRGVVTAISPRTGGPRADLQDNNAESFPMRIQSPFYAFGWEEDNCKSQKHEHTQTVG